MSTSETKMLPSVKLGLLLLAVLPCLPGIIFLAVGAATDPHRHPRDTSPGGEVEYARTWERTRGLYLAGGAVLMVGTLGMAGVIWKIARPGKWPDEEEAETSAVSADPSD